MKKSKNLLSALLLVGALAASAAPAYRGAVQLSSLMVLLLPSISVVTNIVINDSQPMATPSCSRPMVITVMPIKPKKAI